MYISKKNKKKIRARRKRIKASRDSCSGNSTDTSQERKQPIANYAIKDKLVTETSAEVGSYNFKDDETKNFEEAEYFILMPKGLSGKHLKKFRKEERRKARRKGMDDTLLKFVDEKGVPIVVGISTLCGEDSDTNQEKEDNKSKRQACELHPDTSTPPSPEKKRRRKIIFPRINELLVQAEKAKRLEEEKEKRIASENLIPTEEKARYVALDCEMVGIGSDGKQSALARVSITDWHGQVILDTFVQVPDKVTDFRTGVSGIRPRNIKHTSDAMELHACRQKVGQILKNKILVGHALRNDFAALMLDHPKHQIRDTARYKPFMRASGRNGGKFRPKKLRDLAKEHLDLDIQVDGEEHSSVDDASATMMLYKFAREKWEKMVQEAAPGNKK